MPALLWSEIVVEMQINSDKELKKTPSKPLRIAAVIQVWILSKVEIYYLPHNVPFSCFQDYGM